MDKIKVPVILFTGFLEAGKTKFIQESLEDKRFNDKEKTLLIVCEEGIEEYEPEKFSGKNVVIKVFEEEEELDGKVLANIFKESGAERVIVEYNGMWSLDALYGALPEGWAVVQEMMFADAETFLNYNQNMRSLVVDKLQSAEMLVFNRVSEDMDKMEFHKIVRGISSRVNIAYEYKDGKVEYDEIEDPLPFDTDAPLIEIGDNDYAIWYRDMNEDIQKYVDKEITFKAMVGFDKSLPKNTFLAGRHIMTCCADDIEFFPVICKGSISSEIKNADWVIVSGKFAFEFNKAYMGKGPVIKDVRVKKAEKPEVEVASFY